MDLEQHKKELFSKKKDTKAIPIELLVNIIETVNTRPDGEAIFGKDRLKKHLKYAKNLLASTTIIYLFFVKSFRKRKIVLINMADLISQKYIIFLTGLISDNHCDEALYVLNDLMRRQATKNSDFFPIYLTLVSKILNARPETVTYGLLSMLRNFLFEVLKQMKVPANFVEEIDEQTIKKFEKCLFAVHFNALQKAIELIIASQEEQQTDGAFETMKNKLKVLQHQLKMSGLRYIGLIQCDKAFYDAAIACSALDVPKYDNMAFLLFSVLMGIIAESEIGDEMYFTGEMLFEGTDVPNIYTIPTQLYLTPKEKAEVVIQHTALSVGRIFNQTPLPLDSRGCYEASTVDIPGSVSPVCVISGYPVLLDVHHFGNDIMATGRAFSIFNALIKEYQSKELLDIQDQKLLSARQELLQISFCLKVHIILKGEAQPISFLVLIREFTGYGWGVTNIFIENYQCCDLNSLHRDCPFDSVEVFDGHLINNQSRQLIICGDKAPEGELKSTGNGLIVRFTSDHSTNFEGFRMVLTATLGPNKGCGGSLKALENNWQKINVPIDPITKQYYPNLRCEWNIEAEKGNLIEIRLIELKLEQKLQQQHNIINSTLANNIGISLFEIIPCFDYIAIYDGPKSTSPLLLNPSCNLPLNENELIPSFISSHRHIDVLFFSDSTTELSGNGFQAEYRSIKSDCGGAFLANTEWTEIIVVGFFIQHNNNL
ncbi:hypothetical protein Mgra_00005944 [Meloidogyne graminicola]|uniref:CUB domain-containing protein n=1 Tax=Meloidogyne graminicola TaxID=189291 RepID=A0A8S9ZMB2_9BILA|nr:hypothetical protein Mgra_00005944 [Meloidogyne graminicola]